MTRALICWFRGHTWRYDGCMWASGMAPHDCYVCKTCGTYTAEPVEKESAGRDSEPALAPA